MTTTSTDTTPEAMPDTAEEVGALVYRDPRVLAAHPANLRTGLEGKALDDLAKSIAARGVLEPLLIVPDADGEGERIIAGHRRNAAAIQADLDRVPCILRADLTGLADTVITMLVENTGRSPGERHGLGSCFFRRHRVGEVVGSPSQGAVPELCCGHFGPAAGINP